MADQLGLNEERLKKVLKLNNVSTIVKLDPASDAGHRALLLIQIFQYLYSLSAGEEKVIKMFMNTKNRITKGIPIEQVEKEHGLVKVLECVRGISQQSL